MILDNKLNITNQIELSKAEEKISKQKAKQLFDSGDINKVKIGTFEGLAYIHNYLFGEIYDFAGKIRTVNISKGDFRFAPLMYLEASLEYIDKMSQSNFEQIIEKYVEMNIAHPFREGNGRTNREFIRQLALKNGYILNLKNTSPKQVLDASIKSVADTSDLENIIEKMLESE